MFIEIHMLQNFAPSNLNRDDTGNPKDTEFGGVRRARISSQCIKRAIRNEKIFSETTSVDLGIRTRWMNRLLAEALVNKGKDETQAQLIADAFSVQYSKMDKNHTSVLIYLSKNEVMSITDRLLENWEAINNDIKDGKSPLIDALAKELFKTIKDRTGAPDIALFGRMLAEKPELNIDAACQVAHAISTHRVSMDMDFYTAVDDLTRDDETGAGMMGVVAFNSACFYRYARIDWELLVQNLGDDKDLARKTVKGFLRASISAVPTGKQNSFAAQNPPDFILGVARKDGVSWSLANAFEKPIKASRDGGYITRSMEALDAYWEKLNRVFGNQGVTCAALSLVDDTPLINLKDAVKPDKDTWIETLIAELE